MLFIIVIYYGSLNINPHHINANFHYFVSMGAVHLSVRTVSVYLQCIIFWWDVLIYNQLRMMCLEMSVWWSHSDSICNYNFVGKPFFYLPQIHFSFLTKSLLLFYCWFYLSYTTCVFTTVVCPFGMHFRALFYLI